MLHESTNWGHYFSASPTSDGTAILRGHPSHVKVSPLAERLQGKGSTFISQLFLDPEYWSGAGNRSNPQPSALQSSALPSELILPRLKSPLLLFVF